MKRIIALILAALCVAALCACNSGNKTGETAASPDSAEQLTNKDAAGLYTAFGMSFEEYPDMVIDTAEYLSTTITLNEDGTGSSLAEDEEFVVESWKLDGEKITVKIDGAEIKGTLKNGIMILVYGDTSIYMAKEGADRSSVKLITADEFEEKLAAEMPDDEGKEE